MTVSNAANGAMLSSRPPEIEVASGHFVDLLNPDPATIKLHDIARGLAHTCRYGGHVKRFYSVAEHAVLVRDLLRWQGYSFDHRIGGLFHDAAEAYLGDVVAPMKWALRSAEFDYSGAIHRASRLDDFRGALADLEERMDRAIGEALNVRTAFFDDPAVKLADMWALRIEARELTTSGGAHWRWPGELPNGGMLPAEVDWIGGREPDDACKHWLRAVAQEGSATSGLVGRPDTSTQERKNS